MYTASREMEVQGSAAAGALYLQGSSGDADVENRPVGTRGEEEERTEKEALKRIHHHM